MRMISSTSTFGALAGPASPASAENQTYRHQKRPALYIPLFFALLIFISTGANAQSTSYCVPLYGDNSGGSIEYVQLGTINTSAPAPNYTTDLAQGSAQRLIVTTAAANRGANDEIFANVWIDYNADGDFNDGGEHIASTSLPSNGIRYFAITFTVPDNAVPGPTRMRIRTSVDHYDGEGPCDRLPIGEAEDYIVTIIVPPSCTGTPVLGNAVTSNPGPVCSGTSFNLSVNPYPGPATMAYQWEVSTAGASGPFTAIPGQIYTTATITGQTQNSWYRLTSTCNTSGLSAASAAINVTQQPDITACYCVPTITNSGHYYNIYINSLQLGTINNTTGLNASSYTSYLSAPTATQTTDLIQGSPQTITVEVHGGDLNRYANAAAAWIDYNRDGDFDDPGERVFISYLYTNRVVAGFTVPANAVPGPTRLRIVGGFNEPFDPCFQTSPGEAEDYLVTIVTPCSVQPVTTTVTASGPTTFCQGGSVTLTASGADTYLWSNGATTASITVAAAGSYTVTGTNTIGCSNTSAPVIVATIKPANAGTDGTLSVCTGTTPTEAQLFAAITGEDAGGLWSGPVNNVYTYTVSATAPCTETDISTVTVTTQAAPNAGTNGTFTLCEGTTLTSAQLFAALGGSPTTGGSWSPALAGAGIYTYTVAARPPCTANATATVTVTTVNKTVNAGCFSATIARTYNAANNRTTFTYNVCANGCPAALGYIAFITQTNVPVVSPLKGATYKTAKYIYKVSVPVGVENGKTIYGIKYELTSKGEGIKNKGECDTYTFTLAGNIPANAITVQFKAGTQVINASAECQTGSSIPTLAASQNKVTEQTIITALNVNAYPNPYKNKVRFEINSPEAGQGSLEVFNVLGQKVKTVYQGHITKGTRLFELNVPARFRSTLIYRLSVNGKQVTGKLMSAGE